jgi:hypothetical protein
MSKKGLGDVQLAGKVKTKTFKQCQLERPTTPRTHNPNQLTFDRY